MTETTANNSVTRGPGRPWQPGQSGNPSGRPIGSRNKFAEAFVSDVAEAWAKDGASILNRVAQDEPAKFLDVCARIVPKDVQVSLSARMPNGLEAEDWQALLELLGAVKAALPGDTRRPGEITQLVTDALRLHSAKLVEG